MDELVRTTAAYERDADAFVDKYESESVAAWYLDDPAAAFPGRRVLDVGCGPGADVATFADAGVDVVGFDITASFLERARGRVDAPLVRGDMRSLPFTRGAFDGIWACASLLHVPREAVPDTLEEFKRVLDTPGRLFATLKRAGTDRHADDDRYFERYTPAGIRSLADDAGFEDVTVEPTADRWLELAAETT